MIFNPYEVAFSGYRNSGKTTLVTKLMESLACSHDIGYVKHDRHRFDVDVEGKDTKRAADAGARTVWINDGDHAARIHFGETEKFERLTSMQEVDFVFAEGYKKSDMPKVVVLDNAGEILAAELENIIAYAGASNQPPDSLEPNVPYFCRDDTEGIEALIMEHWAAQTMAMPLSGLVLTGGKSSRMQQDKSAMNYHGVTQTQFVYELLAGVTRDCYVSTRAEQGGDHDKESLPQIHDTMLGIGPTGGILSAMQGSPDAAWLVVACDLPYLEPLTLQSLLAGRDPFKTATAFRSAHDGFPEPLCAVYEPKARYRLCQFMGLGYTCPRKVLINSNIELLEQKNPRWLDNVNTPDEHRAAMSGMPGRSQVEVP
ncbi:MAG: molybdopterin-guanine dinucleotide biosynthesis protein B [Verrucomicrobia bacterium]|nr:molybdopterin-guanine dinucleotide biosynthesis protein B [Verrucomicrobiota bacterium]MDA1087739.1 molybdopterin-guanine dinucleotide biosynthesis protein B [Verrucomicrobiota bacterium]